MLKKHGKCNVCYGYSNNAVEHGLWETVQPLHLEENRNLEEELSSGSTNPSTVDAVTALSSQDACEYKGRLFPNCCLSMSAVCRASSYLLMTFRQATQPE